MGEKCRRREAIALIRLHILVEGQTEEGFVNDILAPELGTQNIFVDAHRITTGRRHGRLFRGGLTNYQQLGRDLELWMKQDQNKNSWFTTMIDFYGLPSNFPGRAGLPQNLVARDQVAYYEAELVKDIVFRLQDLPVSSRLVPYIQLHEFEALLFSEPAGFLEAFPDDQRAVNRLQQVRDQFPSPEEINDGVNTAPSKRILSILPDFQKPVAGLLTARRIGLATFRRECRHFDDWITRLLALTS